MSRMGCCCSKHKKISPEIEQRRVKNANYSAVRTFTFGENHNTNSTAGTKTHLSQSSSSFDRDFDLPMDVRFNRARGFNVPLALVNPLINPISNPIFVEKRNPSSSSNKNKNLIDLTNPMEGEREEDKENKKQSGNANCSSSSSSICSRCSRCNKFKIVYPGQEEPEDKPKRKPVVRIRSKVQEFTLPPEKPKSRSERIRDRRLKYIEQKILERYIPRRKVCKV